MECWIFGLLERWMDGVLEFMTPLAERGFRERGNQTKKLTQRRIKKRPCIFVSAFAFNPVRQLPVLLPHR
jgi:hypothetical protein